MITFKTGNLFDTECEALVNTVNCVGVMGRGVALQFKKRFPENFKAYEKACRNNEVMPGKMFVYRTDGMLNPKWIINFPTKRHWRGASRLEDIDSGLDDLVRVIRDNGIHSLVLPPLGCGLGGLNWGDVKRLISTKLGPLPETQIQVFEPGNNPVPAIPNVAVPNMTPGRAALVMLVKRYLDGLLDPFLCLLEIHKLMYFLQEAGEPLKLKFVKAPYGPYAENLRHVLQRTEGHLLSGYADGGDSPKKQMTLVPGSVKDAESFLRGHDETQKRINRVMELIEGFESPLGMELMASVYWVYSEEHAGTKDEIVSRIHQWNERKRQFTPRQIGLAYERLLDKQWISKERVHE